jgi:hypothetical protein
LADDRQRVGDARLTVGAQPVQAGAIEEDIPSR